MKKIAKIVFVLAAAFLIYSQSAHAGEPPQPEQGNARGVIDVHCIPPELPWRFPDEIEGDIAHTVDIDFWNVGKDGGDQYRYVSLDIQPHTTRTSCNNGGTYADEFYGGPNGKFLGTMRMVNGKYIELTWRGVKYNIPVLNPEIFTRYDWTEGAVKSQLENSMAAFSDLSGQVEVNIPNDDGTYDEEKWDFAKLDGKTFPVGTHIKTSEDSSVILSFGDMTTFTMKPGTEIILSSPAAKDSQVKLLAGNLWINVKKMLKDGSMEIEMSQAVAGIKGTVLVVEETGDHSALKVIEGSVAFTSKTNGKTEMISAGESMTADTSGLGQKTAFDANAEKESWDTLVNNLGKENKQQKTVYYLVGLALLIIVVAGVFFFRKRHD